MKIAHRLYPNWDGVSEFEDYRPIISYLGRQVAIAYSEELDGFCFVAYARGSEIGILEFAFGCCKDCDRLNACRSYEEVDFVIEQMAKSIEWIKRYELPVALLRIRSRLFWPRQIEVFEAFKEKLWGNL